MPAQKRGTTGSGSCYFRYASKEGLFLLQGRLPGASDRLAALQPAFEKALGDTMTVGVGQVPAHLYHLRAAASH